MNSSWRNPEFFLKLGVASGLILVFLYGLRFFEYNIFYKNKKVILVILSRNQSIFNNMKKDLMAHINKDWYVLRLSHDDRFQVVYNAEKDAKGNQESIKDLDFICNGEEKTNKDSLKALISNKKYTPIIVADQTGSKDDLVSEILVLCYDNQVPVFSCFDFYEAICKKALIFESDGKWFWDFSYLRYSMTKVMTKRSFDMILALFLLPLVIVPGLLIAFLIKIESKGPILFVQERLGLRRKIFKMLKFRTMIVHPDDSEQWPKVELDLVTRFGHFLRKTGLDEVPQLINILKSEMSFVGPRPARPKVAEMHCSNIPFFALTHSVMPGITGWAQLHQGQDSGYDTILERIKYNAYYMKHYSILLDLYIILKTAKMVFKIKKPESTQTKVKANVKC